VRVRSPGNRQSRRFSATPKLRHPGETIPREMDETYFKQSYAYAYAQLRQPIPSCRRWVESAVAVASLAVRLVSAEAQCCPRVHPQVVARPAPSVTGRSAVLRPGTCTQHPGILWQGGDNGPKEIPCLTSPTLCPASMHQCTNGPSGDFVPLQACRGPSTHSNVEARSSLPLAGSVWPNHAAPPTP
jgi:hypothetical protein